MSAIACRTELERYETLKKARYFSDTSSCRSPALALPDDARSATVSLSLLVATASVTHVLRLEAMKAVSEVDQVHIDTIPADLLHFVFAEVPCYERLKVMPLVSREWANALSHDSVAWEHLDLTQPPADWSKLAFWASRHYRHTRALTIEHIAHGSEDGLKQLLHCKFLHLCSIKLLGSISSSIIPWCSALHGHNLQSLHLQLESISQWHLDCLGRVGLQHLILEVKKADPAVSIRLPSNSSNLQSLSLRNVPLAGNVFPFGLPEGFQSLTDLSLVRTGVRRFDFVAGQMSQLSSLLLSEDYSAGQYLELSGISALSSLKRLSISSGLEQFPDDILSMTSVTSLDLGWNKFRMLPAGSYLTNLKELQFQERSSFLDVSVLEQASGLQLLSFDATDMAYNDIIATVISLIKRLSSLQRVVLLKASYNGAADREDQIAQSFLKLVNLLCQDMFCRRSIQIDLEHKWKPLLWCDTCR